MQLLAPKCSLQKYMKHPVDFMRQHGFLLRRLEMTAQIVFQSDTLGVTAMVLP